MTRLEREAERWRRLLRLQEWDVQVEPVALTTTDKGEGGTIDWNTMMMQARIRVCTERPPEAQLATVRHELLHLALFEMVRASRMSEDALPVALRDCQREDMDTAEERTVIRLERMLDALLPDGG